MNQPQAVKPSIRFWMLLLVSTSTIAVVGIAWYFLELGGGAEHRRIEWTLPSANGDLVAHVLSVSSGGATVGASWEVVVVRVGTTLRLESSEEQWIWKAYRIRPDHLRWVDSTTLEVPLDGSYGTYRDSVRTRVVDGIGTVTVWTHERKEPRR
ncbi:MAG TPA: hypothetical protein P5234_16405 [Thermoanaerobaculaceae bacterium]|nr:hypothetical protein [Thermoanaerobaculaceae bacterium]